MALDEKFAKWKGVPREEIDWAPIIDIDKCTGCGMCATSCGRSVFDYNWENKKAVVVRPLQCMVGCTSCEVWCVFNAISFPDKKYIREVIKKRGVLNLAKKEIETKFKK
jgi:NAD-dependent dihydropyrimidine dehydrogenase PreA subunit